MLSELSTFQIGQQSFSMIEAHQKFKETHPAGHILSEEQVRWSRYLPKDILKHDWKSPRILGLDANNLAHCYLTFQDTVRFVNVQNQSNSNIKFNDQETFILSIMAETHDWGEGVTGDRNYEKKTRQDEIEELKALKVIFTDVFGQDNEVEKLAQQIIFYLDSENHEQKLSKAFNAIECIGYFQTAIRAWQKSPEFNTKHPRLATNLQLVTNNVFLNNLPSLIGYAGQYPRVRTILQNQGYWINQAFTMKKSIMDQYDTPEKIPEYKEKFALAKSQWNQWARANL